MKQQSIKIVILGLLLSISQSYAANADASGQWSGTMLPEGSTDPALACTASVSITQTDTSLSVGGGNLNCPAFFTEIPPEEFTISNGLILSADGGQHGSVDNISVRFDLPPRNLNMKFLLSAPLAKTFLLIQGTREDGQPVDHEGFLTR